MTIEQLDIEGGMRELTDRDLLTHNPAHAVRRIEPGDTNSAAALLMWSSFDTETSVEPPTFPVALRSRIDNIRDAFMFLEELDERAERAETWREAGRIIVSLTPPEISAARIAIQEFNRSVIN